jgi:hypothetical protein
MSPVRQRDESERAPRTGTEQLGIDLLGACTSLQRERPCRFELPEVGMRPRAGVKEQAQRMRASDGLRDLVRIFRVRERAAKSTGDRFKLSERRGQPTPLMLVARRDRARVLAL